MRHSTTPQPLSPRSIRPRRNRPTWPHLLPVALGPYRPVKALGRGGTATVYLGVDPRPEAETQPLALKVLHPHLAADGELRKMFLQEAAIASKLDHPNVCRVYDHGETEGVPYIAMEYVCGESLRDLGPALVTRRAALPGLGARTTRTQTSLVRRIIADVAKALHALHELRSDAGIPLEAIHRDVTPDNILVGCTGEVKLLDFGVAKSLASQWQTASGMVRGKLAYLAPEIVRHQPMDRRVDIWTLGVVLWELLTGKRMFRRDEDASTLHAILHHVPMPPSQCGAAVPSYLDELVMSMLSSRPEERPETALAVAEALLRPEPAAKPDAIRRWLHAHYDHSPTCRTHAMDVAAAALPQGAEEAHQVVVGPSGRRFAIIPGSGGD